MRISPAKTGNTSVPSELVPSPPDHPRKNGEHLHEWCARRQHYGSPPQKRGTPKLDSCRSDPYRITPAKTGNTRWVTARWPISPDHPRKNGEHQEFSRRPCSFSGSPPQKRGTPNTPCPQVDTGRITPAKTGNTLTSKPRRRSTADHPRKNGEHWLGLRQGKARGGSPPQKRGTRVMTKRIRI